MDKIKELLGSGVSRRTFLAGVSASVGTAAAATLVVGCGSSSTPTPTTTPPPTTPPMPSLMDADYLNFALNLEYLEAEFYLRAATGQGLADADAGSGGTSTSPGAVTGGAMVQFSDPIIKAYALEIANDELLHVRFLRKALGSAAVARPAIDLTAGFNAAAMAAGLGATFNPFTNDANFLVGAFTFEDVGVTAYHGAAGLLTDKGNLSAAAGILSTEAYHAAEIRTVLAYMGGDPLNNANAISKLRAAAGGGNETPVSTSTIVAADPKTSIAFARTTDQVLHIVYVNPAAGTAKGGFFPNGLNGLISATTT